jgi:replicative DNA helicase
VREKGVKLLMIDYLQLMNANGMKFGSRQEEVSTISRSLKGLAKELNIPVLALSQLSRNVENRNPVGDTAGDPEPHRRQRVDSLPQACSSGVPDTGRKASGYESELCTYYAGGKAMSDQYHGDKL